MFAERFFENCYKFFGKNKWEKQINYDNDVCPLKVVRSDVFRVKGDLRTIKRWQFNDLPNNTRKSLNYL